MPSVVCAVCGAVNQKAVVPETDDSGAPDFDTRPGEPTRGTLQSWVMRCVGCGYCSADLTHIHEGGSEILALPVYRAVLDDSSLPPKAREFLCYSMILEHADLLADAGWSALHAAWASDDAQLEQAAVRCRHLAIELWKRGKQHGQNFGDDLLSEFALATDVYRRMGEFELAVVTCSEALDMDEVPGLLAAILRRQKSFIENKDRSRHTLAELAT